MEDWIQLGDEAKEQHDYKRAIEYYKKAAYAGSTDGMVAVSLLYQFGEGVE